MIENKLRYEMIYWDNAATTPLLSEVQAKMAEVMRDQSSGVVGNASALHGAGQRARRLVEEARAEVAMLIGADPEEIIFVSGGSEANNTVMHIFADKNIAISSIEHPSVAESARYYAMELTLIPVDADGRVDFSEKYINGEYKEPVLQDVDLISVMLANNELGTIEPIQEIVKHYKTSDTFIHTDATQAMGKINVDVDDLGVDYLTISAHKIGGPIGIGALYVRKGSPYQALILGGHQENGRRAGTTNVAAAVGFGEAARLARLHLTKYQHIAKLRDKLRERILAEVPYAKVNSPWQNCLPNILNMSFAASEGESIQLYLDAYDIMVSTSSACAAGDLQPSPVLMAVFDDAERAHNSIRFSLGLDMTEKDIAEVMKVLPDIIKRLQGISTVTLAK